jgi:hypothetical protein
MANGQQYTEGQMLAGSDGNTYVVRGGVPRQVVSGGNAPAPRAPLPVYKRPKSAPIPAPIGPTDTPEFRAAVAAAEATARIEAGRIAGQDATARGRAGLDSTISELKKFYDQLKTQGGAISEKQGLLDNAVNWAAANIGETIGNPTASKAESTRATIRNVRNILVRDIMSATGMSSKQVDNSFELQRLLQLATDPTQTLETVNATLGTIQKRYGSPTAAGATAAKKQAAPAATSGFTVKRRN